MEREDNGFRGWLEGVPTSVTFTADTEAALRVAFEKALDAYLNG